ncbi:hypothetical protein ACFW1A_04940 [Kitasatospora sp. NPDC058965]|uniref:hypothetical protein n=1 Tax=Kitasatospora sp. NPDC058965 TaxID=3346682 RepID=UPI0036BC7D65
MAGEEHEEFRMALLGPSGVGKTTMLTAMFSETDEALSGKSARVVTETATEARIRKHKVALREAEQTGVFSSGGIAGTDIPEFLGFALRSAGLSRVEIPFRILDYPGGWLDPGYRQRKGVSEENWRRVEDHLVSSILMVVPIDAALLMEAGDTRRALASYWLDVVGVEETVRIWAKTRNLPENRAEPAVLVLAPVKCETYLRPGRPAGSDARALRDRVRQMYAQVLELVAKEAEDRDIRVVYVPVQTYVNITLIDGRWTHSAEVNREAFAARYRFTTSPPRSEVRGAVDVMRELCACVFEGRRRLAELEEQERLDQQSGLQARRYSRKGFFGTLAYHFSGDARRDDQAIGASGRAVQRARQEREQLESDIRMLATLPVGPHVEEWR